MVAVTKSLRGVVNTSTSRYVVGSAASADEASLSIINGEMR